MKKLSIIITCLNNEDNLSEFYDELFNVLKKVSRKYTSEMLFIDNGSIDKTLDKIKEIHKIDPRVKYISLIKTVNESTSIYIGLKNLNTDYICFLNARQKYSINLIEHMLYSLDKQNFDVCACKVKKDYSLLCSIVNSITKENIEPGEIGCKMITKRTAESILNSSELNNVTKGIFNWNQYDTEWILCDDEKDITEEENIWKDTLCNYIKQSLPLIMPIIIGNILMIGSFILLFTIIIRNILYSYKINSLLLIIGVIIFIGGLNLSLISSLIKYLIKNNKEINTHNTYIIKEEK